jgi:hypothetical protein
MNVTATLDSRRWHYIGFYAVQGQWWEFDGESIKAVPSYAIFEENCQKLQTASLLLHQIFTPQIAAQEHLAK